MYTHKYTYAHLHEQITKACMCVAAISIFMPTYLPGLPEHHIGTPSLCRQILLGRTSALQEDWPCSVYNIVCTCIDHNHLSQTWQLWQVLAANTRPTLIQLGRLKAMWVKFLTQVNQTLNLGLPHQFLASCTNTHTQLNTLKYSVTKQLIKIF